MYWVYKFKALQYQLFVTKGKAQIVVNIKLKISKALSFLYQYSCGELDKLEENWLTHE